MILATHLTQELEQIADYILYVENGKLLMNYDIETLRSRYRIAVAEDYKLKLLPENMVICREKGNLASRVLIRYYSRFPYDKELTFVQPTIEEIMYFVSKRERGKEYEF